MLRALLGRPPTTRYVGEGRLVSHEIVLERLQIGRFPELVCLSAENEGWLKTCVVSPRVRVARTQNAAGDAIRLAEMACRSVSHGSTCDGRLDSSSQTRFAWSTYLLMIGAVARR